MPLIEDEHVVQALRPDRSHPALGDGVRRLAITQARTPVRSPRTNADTNFAPYRV